MLGRTVVPLLRRQTLQSSLQRTFVLAQCRPFTATRHTLRDPIRWPTGASKSNNRDRRIDELKKDEVDQSQDKYSRPLRPVPASESERILADSQNPIVTPPPNAKSYERPAVSADRPRQASKARHESDDIESPSEAESQQPLPDLTRGIPSTIDAELDQARGQSRAQLDSLNITEEPSEPQKSDPRGSAGDGLPRSAYVSSSDRRRSKLLRVFYTSSILGILLYGLYQGREWDSEEEAAAHKDSPTGYSPSAMYARAMARLGSSTTYYTDPVTKKFLPDLNLLDPLTPEFVLVLGLEDLLIKSEWSRDHGWRIAKRPGLDYFLRYLSMYYELVIFSAQPAFTVEQIHRKLDPYQMVYPLFREMTTYEDGGYVKDLSYLNRDLKKVVMIDTDEHAVKKQPENAIVLPKWDGNPNDTTLVDFIPFLEYLANIGFKDTREVLKSFQGQYIPVEFDRRQKAIREKFMAEQAEKNKHKPRRSASIGSWFGGSQPKTPDGSQTLTQAEAEGKMIFDQIRERGKENYARLTAYLDKEGAKIIAEREALEKKAMEEAQANMKNGMFGWFGGGAKPADSGSK